MFQTGISYGDIKYFNPYTKQWVKIDINGIILQTIPQNWQELSFKIENQGNHDYVWRQNHWYRQSENDDTEDPISDTEIRTFQDLKNHLERVHRNPESLNTPPPTPPTTGRRQLPPVQGRHMLPAGRARPVPSMPEGQANHVPRQEHATRVPPPKPPKPPNLGEKSSLAPVSSNRTHDDTQTDFVQQMNNLVDDLYAAQGNPTDNTTQLEKDLARLIAEADVPPRTQRYYASQHGGADIGSHISSHEGKKLQGFDLQLSSFREGNINKYDQGGSRGASHEPLHVQYANFFEGKLKGLFGVFTANIPPTSELREVPTKRGIPRLNFIGSRTPTKYEETPQSVNDKIINGFAQEFAKDFGNGNYGSIQTYYEIALRRSQELSTAFNTEVTLNPPQTVEEMHSIFMKHHNKKLQMEEEEELRLPPETQSKLATYNKMVDSLNLGFIQDFENELTAIARQRYQQQADTNVPLEIPNDELIARYVTNKEMEEAFDKHRNRGDQYVRINRELNYHPHIVKNFFWDLGIEQYGNQENMLDKITDQQILKILNQAVQRAEEIANRKYEDEHVQETITNFYRSYNQLRNHNGLPAIDQEQTRLPWDMYYDSQLPADKQPNPADLARAHDALQNELKQYFQDLQGLLTRTGNPGLALYIVGEYEKFYAPRGSFPDLQRLLNGNCLSVNFTEIKFLGVPDAENLTLPVNSHVGFQADDGFNFGGYLPIIPEEYPANAAFSHWGVMKMAAGRSTNMLNGQREMIDRNFRDQQTPERLEEDFRSFGLDAVKVHNHLLMSIKAHSATGAEKAGDILEKRLKQLRSEEIQQAMHMKLLKQEDTDGSAITEARAWQRLQTDPQALAAMREFAREQGIDDGGSHTVTSLNNYIWEVIGERQQGVATKGGSRDMGINHDVVMPINGMGKVKASMQQLFGKNPNKSSGSSSPDSVENGHPEANGRSSGEVTGKKRGLLNILKPKSHTRKKTPNANGGQLSGSNGSYSGLENEWSDDEGAFSSSDEDKSSVNVEYPKESLPFSELINRMKTEGKTDKAVLAAYHLGNEKYQRNEDIDHDTGYENPDENMINRVRILTGTIQGNYSGHIIIGTNEEPTYVYVPYYNLAGNSTSAQIIKNIRESYPNILEPSIPDTQIKVYKVPKDTAETFQNATTLPIAGRQQRPRAQSLATTSTNGRQERSDVKQKRIPFKGLFGNGSRQPPVSEQQQRPRAYTLATSQPHQVPAVVAAGRGTEIGHGILQRRQLPQPQARATTAQETAASRGAVRRGVPLPHLTATGQDVPTAAARGTAISRGIRQGSHSNANQPPVYRRSEHFGGLPMTGEGAERGAGDQGRENKQPSIRDRAKLFEGGR